MRRYIAYALVLIALIALAVWAISKFVQPILPPGINADLLLFVAAISGLFGLPGAIKNTVELLRMASGRDKEAAQQTDLEKLILALSQRGAGSKEDYEAALKRYLAWLSNSTGTVWLRGIQRGEAKAIELSLGDIYAPLAAEALPEARDLIDRDLDKQPQNRETPGAERILLRDLLSQGDHLAVIGAPGCGKTTVLQHIAWTLAEALSSGQPELATERLGLTGLLPLPIFIPLSLYADHRRQFADHPDPRQRQLTTFIDCYLHERQLNLPSDFCATLLEQGRHLILLLDGLDEVPNEDERALVAQAVRDLKFGQPNARFIVTSRTPAYVGRAVLGDEFRVIRVLPLDEEQIASLIRKAYQALFRKDEEQGKRAQFTDDLIAGVQKLEQARAARLAAGEEGRLVTTPLMVRMLLIVHFNLHRRLPDQRAELYMEVVDTLLTSSHNPDEKVAQRLAELGGDWRGRRLMHQFLAFQTHSRGRNAGRYIAEREMSDLLCGYLEERQRRPRLVAEELVADLIATSRQRGGLLEETGGRYRFSHLSFQEFLTARYLAETERDPARIADFIEAEGRALDPWWREPILLTLGYLSIPADDAASDLIRRLGHIDGAVLHTALALTTTEIAASAYLEWGGPETDRQALARNLVDLLEDHSLQDVPPGTRAAAGDALARLGDTRPGVGLTVAGLPNITWCDVPAGLFLMGNTKDTDELAYDDERPQIQLDLPAYRISKYLITNAQYDAFVQDGGYTAAWRRCWTAAGWQWKAKRTAAEKAGGVFDLPNHPVVNVTWYEAMAFCGWLSEKLGYSVTLPTEAQWEKAARGPLPSPPAPLPARERGEGVRVARYPWGSDEITPEHANYDATGIVATSAVGVFPLGASPCGALDMAGNAWEWCLTQWRANYTLPADDDPAGDAARVLRGGAFLDNARFVRCASRYGDDPNGWGWLDGFRVVAPPVIHDSGL